MAAYLSCVVVNTLEDQNVASCKPHARRLYTWTRRKRQSKIILAISGVIVSLSVITASVISGKCSDNRAMWGAIVRYCDYIVVNGGNVTAAKRAGKHRYGPLGTA